MRVAKGLEPLLKRAALASVRRRGNSLQPPIAREPIRRVMIYRPERFGDLLATLPVIRALKAILPSSELHIWTSTQGRELLEPEPPVDHVLVISGKSRDRKLVQKTGTFDLVIDLQMRDSVNSLLTCNAAAGDGVLVGYGKDRLRAYYDWAPALAGTDIYAMHVGLGVLSLLRETAPASPKLLPLFSGAEIDRAAAIIGTSPEPTVLNLSAGDSNRRLEVETWRRVIDHLLRTADRSMLLSAIGDDRSTAERFAQEFGARVRATPSDLSFREAACLITRARLFVSADTSLVHIAAAANVPTVALYLPQTDFRMSWIPPYRHVVTVQAEGSELASVSVETICNAIDVIEKREYSEVGGS